MVRTSKVERKAPTGLSGITTLNHRYVNKTLSMSKTEVAPEINKSEWCWEDFTGDK